MQRKEILSYISPKFCAVKSLYIGKTYFCRDFEISADVIL
jgi:hypothetical protein